MRTPNYSIRKESYESQREAGRYNPGLELVIGNRVMPISAGHGDDIDVRTEGGEVFVLARNYRMGYVGLEVFDAEGERVGDIFIQSEDEAKELMGPQGIHYSAPYCIRLLLNYIY